ncbi:ESX-1 secretion-associated protein [Mycobacterium sp. 236(2023)]|uniref:ESX-1 secretion-associated protein n=1 Tax=Mycobacterium sp. 236(2023) TaxID=3038163 RepID=UPI0024156832|nr:ESX-1 secretion-associated protein [Mycobacterium sp. 236(2023)]MDG4668379.1 ESX-1 secretion-associated protein [Mycobacterium sp. 236(2023)]
MTRIEDLNLKVVTEHIDELAGHHETAADKILGANRFAQGVAGRVEITHGLICFATSSAMADAESSRSSAGQALQRVSTELGEKLRNTSANYQNTDYMNKQKLSSECQT